MEKKIQAIIIIVIVAGSVGVSVGLTAGIILTQQGSRDQILLVVLLSQKPPAQTILGWTWMSGNNTVNQNGIYFGPAAGLVPGSRDASISWTDSNDNLWLFGGTGYDGTGNFGSLNDLWKFNMISGLWMWVSGNSFRNQAGTYGINGTPAASNLPGSRSSSVSWTDSDDNLWLFGGLGNDSTSSSGRLNDLWMFNITSGWWTWVSGNDTKNQNGTYGMKGVSNETNFPGSRAYSSSWTDSNNNLWLFGGSGYDSAGSCDNLNDLWMFNTTSGCWTWMSGNETVNQKGTYGAKGVSNETNIPGARQSSISWTDYNDNLWLFGGFGYADNLGYLNDLWMFNMTSKWWMWVSGNDTRNLAGNYGTMGVPAADNFPGARRYSISWTDANDSLWLFGGDGYDGVGLTGYLNDLWKFNITSGWWVWVSGNNTRGSRGTYGKMGVPSIGNILGARGGSGSWTDSDDNLWLFGGFGYDTTNLGRLNDLWKYG